LDNEEAAFFDRRGDRNQQSVMFLLLATGEPGHFVEVLPQLLHPPMFSIIAKGAM
jgi:hypothetical protein